MEIILYFSAEDLLRGRTKVKSSDNDGEISLDRHVLRRLENMMETFLARKVAAEDNSDHLDFDTDTITITMESKDLSPSTNWKQRRLRRPAFHHSAYYRPYYNYYYAK